MKYLFYLIALSVLILFLINISTTSSPSKEQDQAIFIWDTELINEEVIASLKEDGFNKLYIYYSTHNSEPFDHAIQLCENASMTYYALNGSYEWIDHPEELDEFIDLVGDYAGKSHPHFKGIILDIEPYILKDRNREEDYAVFQGLITSARKQATALDLNLNIVMPFWYEKITLPSMAENENLACWIIRNVDESTIMAYRNKIEGKNGIIALIDEEITYCNISESNSNLIIALETKPSNEGDHISFAETDKTTVLNTIEILNQQQISTTKNIGYAIHDLESWLKLKQNKVSSI